MFAQRLPFASRNVNVAAHSIGASKPKCLASLNTTTEAREPIVRSVRRNSPYRFHVLLRVDLTSEPLANTVFPEDVYPSYYWASAIPSYHVETEEDDRNVNIMNASLPSTIVADRSIDASFDGLCPHASLNKSRSSNSPSRRPLAHGRAVIVQSSSASATSKRTEASSSRRGAVPTLAAAASPKPSTTPQPVVAPSKKAVADSAAVDRIGLVEFGVRSEWFCIPRTVNLEVGKFVVVDGDRGWDMGHLAATRNAPEGRGSKAARTADSFTVRASPTPRVLPTKFIRCQASDAEMELFLEKRLSCDATVQEVSLAILEEAADVPPNERMVLMSTTIQGCEWQADGNKLFVYYTANGQVRFCRLAMRLYRRYGCRIWMHQLIENN